MQRDSEKKTAAIQVAVLRQVPQVPPARPRQTAISKRIEARIVEV